MDQLKPSPPNSNPLTPLTFLERAATVYGECPSIVYNTTTYTWSDTHHRCLRIASSISSLDIGRGHVVSVVAPNVPAAYELHFAVPMAGAVLNNINIRLDPRTISVLLAHSESRLVFVYSQLVPLVLEALSLLPRNHHRPHIVLILDDENDNNTLISSQSRTMRKTLTSKDIKSLEVHNLGLDPDHDQLYTTYDDMIRKGDPEFKWIRPESEWDPIALNYTSGTTSNPKGVVHCHRGAFIMSMDSLIDWSVPKRPVYLWTLPMFHSNGWTFPWGMAAVGATNVCLPKFDGASIYAAIHQHHVTHMCAAPIVLNMLTNLTPRPDQLPWPVHILTGGSPPPAPVLLGAESLGFVVGHGYGMTEAIGVIISCAWKPKWDLFPATERARLKARQGVRTLGMTEITVVDPTTMKPVNQDGKSVGEIVLRGGSIMLGYLKDPEATLKCMGKDGWFKTGDLAVMHPDGYLEIKDRSKDIIISGGENISSVEVESVIYTIPGVNEVAVVARPDEYWGETPCAFVSLKMDKKRKSQTTEKEVIEHCRGKLPHYMVPKTVVFKDELPKTSTGKIQKFVLRELAKSLGTDHRNVTTATTTLLASRL